MPTQDSCQVKVAIIPARGGSKRIPRKNVRDFCGRPILAWSIEAARTSGLFDRIIVSTEDEEIADVARIWGAEAPFRRPAELAGDYVPTTNVIGHAVEWLHSKNIEPTAVCCIQGTAPLLDPNDLRNAFEEHCRGHWDFVFSATHYEYPVQRSLRVTADGTVSLLFPEHLEMRSQDLEPIIHDAGQFYWGTPRAWEKRRRVFASRSRPIIVPPWRAQDIDTEHDWERAEFAFRWQRSRDNR